MNRLIVIILLLCGCTDASPRKLEGWTTLQGRTDQQVYRIKAPQEWQYNPPILETIHDTTKPIGEFIITQDSKTISITIHNFPSQTEEDRIPPMAQIQRWQRQFTHLESMNTTPQAFGGFVGQLFEGSGIFKDSDSTMLAWSMQLAPEHYLVLKYPHTAQELAQFPLWRADITIKAIGPSDLVAQYQQAIVEFARSFELIHSIPVRS